MSPKRRLLASALSSLMVLVIFNVWISSLGILGMDLLLSITPIAIMFTLFATVGVVNAFNLIDGLNGLSSYVTISTAVALSFISFQVDNFQIAIFLILLSFSVLGFFLCLISLLEKFFLEMGVLIFLGHLLVWSALLLISDQTKISTFSILLIFFWPVADTGLAIWRRWKMGNPTDRPDRLHFHQLAMRFLEIRFFGRDRRKIVNPIATVILVPMISTPQILGVLFWNDFASTVYATICAGLLFVVTYVVGIKVAKRPKFFV